MGASNVDRAALLLADMIVAAAFAGEEYTAESRAKAQLALRSEEAGALLRNLAREIEVTMADIGRLIRRTTQALDAESEGEV